MNRDSFPDIGAIGGEKLDGPLATAIPFHLLDRYCCIPISETEDGVRLAMADPTDTRAIEDLGLIFGVPIIPVAASRQEVETLIDRFGRLAIACGDFGCAWIEPPEDKNADLGGQAPKDGSAP